MKHAKHPYKKRPTVMAPFPFANRLTRYVSNALPHANDPRSDVIRLTASLLTQHQQRILVETVIEELGLTKDPENRHVDDILVRFYSYDLSEIETLVELFDSRRIHATSIIKRLLAKAIKTVKTNDDSEEEARLSELSSVFRLSEAEKDILVLLFLLESNLDFANLYDDLVITGRNKSKTAICPHALSITTGLPKSLITKAVQNDSTIFKSGLFEGILACEISDFLAGFSEHISTRYYSEFEGNDVLPLSEFRIPELDIKIIRELLSTGKSAILIYGPAGTGKTTLCRAMARDLQKRLLEVRPFLPTADKDNPNFHQRSFIATQHAANSSCIVLADEADSMLNSNSRHSLFFGDIDDFSGKAVLNSLLEGIEQSTMFVVNHADNIHPSAIRRFDYSLRVEPLVCSDREKIWAKIAGDKSVPLSSTVVKRFANEKLNPAVITKILSNTSRITGVEPETAVGKMISAFQTLSSGEKPAVRIENTYSLEGLNIKGDLNSILTALDGYNAQWDTKTAPLNLLLVGEPGTGKTEFVHFVSRKLGRRLLQKTSADLLGMYVGQSEKQIREAFEEAYRENAILFIDEIDSLLLNRNDAKNWQVSQINELLVRMDAQRPGIFIGATNFPKILDNAVFRRYQIKLEFNFLKADGILHFYRLLLSPLVKVELTNDQRMELENLSCVSIGDLATINKRFEYIPERSHEVLVAALKDELIFKSGRKQQELGFSRRDK